MAETPTLVNLSNLQNETTAVNAINSNSAAIGTAFLDVLSRTGVAPNQMGATIDMNSNRIVNLPAPISLQEPLRLQDANTLNGGGTIASLPSGGVTGSFLEKHSSTDFDADWNAGTVYVYPNVVDLVGIAQGHKIPWLDENIAITAPGIYPLTVNATNPIILGAAGSTIGSSTVGQTFSVRFTSTALAGSPVTITYTAIGGDTTTTIAQNLCTLINANTTIHNATTGLPIFAQQISGNLFNIQWTADLSPDSTHPLTLSSVGTGTINIAATVNVLDYAVLQLARAGNMQGAAQWTPHNGDALIALDYTGFSNHSGTPVFDTHYVNTNVSAQNVQSGSQIGRWTLSTAHNGTTANGVFYGERGLVFYKSDGTVATSGDIGYGTINMPTAGGIYFNGVVAVQPSTGGAGAAGLVSSGAVAGLSFDATGGGVDSKWWDVITSGSVLSFRADNDAQSSATTWMSVTRSGMSITNINFPTQVTFTTSLVSPLVIGGTATSSSLVLESTSGAGASDFIDFKTGSQATQMRILTTGHMLVNSTNSGLVTDDAARFNVIGNSGENTFSLTTYGSQSNMSARCANGTSAAPTQMTTNQTIFEFGVRGFTSSNVFSSANVAAIRFTAAENYTSSAQGTFFQFFTTPTGSTSPGSAAIFWGSSGVSLAGDSTDPGASNVRIAGTLRVLSSTASSSATTGSLIASGGIGVSGDVWASGNHSVSTATKTLLLKQGANGCVGTFVCNGATPVTVTNSNVAITDAIIISLNTVGGTVGGAAKVPPMVTAITGATSFVTTGQATDTSTYNYAIIKNAA